MKIEIEKEGFQGKGDKLNQEDNAVMSKDKRFFILCDGMGGHEKGEVASQTVCDALENYFTKTPPANYEISTEYFNNAVKYAYEKLDEQDPDPDSTKKMGTTLTCVYFGDNAALVAHTGDSRVYQIRPSECKDGNYKNAVLIETKDHSLVQQLVDIGEITEEEAKTHPKRNVITKCMQPHEDYDMPDFDSCDVKAGDYFFLCSDGILENITAEILCQVLSEDIPDSKKKEKLQSYCDDNTRDNYTCLLIHVKSGELPDINGNNGEVLDTVVSKSVQISDSDLDSKEEAAKTETDSDSEPEMQSEPDWKEYMSSAINWIRQHFYSILIAILAIVCVYYLASHIKSCSWFNNEPKPISDSLVQNNNHKNDDKVDNKTKDDNKPKEDAPKEQKHKDNQPKVEEQPTNNTNLDNIRNQYKDYGKRSLGFGMVLYDNPKNSELVLVNENYPIVKFLVKSDGYIHDDYAFKDSDSVFNNIKIGRGDFVINNFLLDANKKDTVATINWRLQTKDTLQTKTLKINSKGIIIQ